MFQDWMIHIQGHLNGALQTHLIYTDHVHTQYAICIYTGQDTMVGNQRV
jgi:hypothetical protein